MISPISQKRKYAMPNMAKAVFAIFAFVVLWLVANPLYFGNPYPNGNPIEEQIHLGVVLALAIFSVLASTVARGSLNDRLKQVILFICISFGTYAILILLGRWFFSRTILATIIPSSFIICLIIIWIRSRTDSARVAIIAPLVKAIPDVLGQAEVLTDPKTDFRSYDLILVDLHAPITAEWAHALSQAMLCGCRVRHIENHVEELSGAVSINHFELEHLPATEHDSYILVKRLLDLGGVLALAPIAAPIVLLAAIAILITSGSPVFFIRPRVGMGGAHFQMWKLRTMRPLTREETDHAAVPGDVRVTSIGRFMRRTRIDELPQLWNVLKGEMSLIGPRPEAVAFHDSYVEVEPKFAYRCLVRPGMTGWAQVNAPPSATADEAIFKAKYDLYYIKRQSLALDIQIVIRTFWTLLHGSGVR